MHTAAEHSDGATTTIKPPRCAAASIPRAKPLTMVSPALASIRPNLSAWCGRNSTRHAYRRWLSPSHQPPSIGRAHTKRWEGRATRAAISGAAIRGQQNIDASLVTLIDYFVRQFNAFGGPQTTRQRNAHAFDFAEFVGRSLQDGLRSFEIVQQRSQRYRANTRGQYQCQVAVQVVTQTGRCVPWKSPPSSWHRSSSWPCFRSLSIEMKPPVVNSHSRASHERQQASRAEPLSCAESGL